MIVKEHRSIDGRVVVAFCDDELIGKRFEEGNLQLNLDSNFYKGGKKTKEEVLKIFSKADIVNIVGEKSIKLALKAKIISKGGIIRIKNIPYAQALLR